MYKRWGILWRPLSFKLSNNVRIVECIFRLHNYVIQFDLDNNIHTFNYKNDEDYMLQEEWFRKYQSIFLTVVIKEQEEYFE